MEFRGNRHGPSPRANSGRGRGGGGGSRRGHRSGGGGGSNGSNVSHSSSNEYYNTQHRALQPRPAQERANRWDEHAAAHDEQVLVSKGLLSSTGLVTRDEAIPEYEDRAAAHVRDCLDHDEDGNDIPRDDDYRTNTASNNSYSNHRYDDEQEEEYGGRREDDYGVDDYDHRYHYNDGYQNGGGGGGQQQEYRHDNYQQQHQHNQQQHQYAPPAQYHNGGGYGNYNQVTPPPRGTNYQSQYDQRDGGYRNNYQQQQRSSADAESYAAIENEYHTFGRIDSERELNMLMRRVEVMRRHLHVIIEDEERDAAARASYPPYPEEQQEFIHNVRGGESFYERDSSGFSPLGRQSYEAQQRRNEQSRGCIPAGRLDRYGTENGRGNGQRSSDGDRRRDDYDDQRGGQHCEDNRGHKKRRNNRTRGRGSVNSVARGVGRMNL